MPEEECKSLGERGNHSLHIVNQALARTLVLSFNHRVIGNHLKKKQLSRMSQDCKPDSATPHQGFESVESFRQASDIHNSELS